MLIDTRELFKQIQNASDLDKSRKMSAYMKGHFPFLGIPTPNRRKICKQFFSDVRHIKTIDWCFIDECWDHAEREYQYIALDYLVKKKCYLNLHDIPKLQVLALSKSWWDTIDILDQLIGDMGLMYLEIDDLMLEWSMDENFWLRRIAINHQLLRKEKTNTNLLHSILVNNLNQKEFFINKAIGWSLRSYSKTEPNWVRNFIVEYKYGLSSLSIREGSKYIS